MIPIIIYDKVFDFLEFGRKHSLVTIVFVYKIFKRMSVDYPHMHKTREANDRL